MARGDSARSLRSPARSTSALRRNARDPPDAVAYRTRRRTSPSSLSLLALTADSCRGCTVRVPRAWPRPSCRRLGLYATRTRGGRRRISRIVVSSRCHPRRADRARRGGSSFSPSAKHTLPDSSRTRRRAVVHGLLGAAVVLFAAGLLGLVVAVGSPCHLGRGSACEFGGGRQRPRPFRTSWRTNNRTVWWGEAWQVFRANPAGGTGASTFEIARKRVRSDAQNVIRHTVPRCSSSPRPGCRDSCSSRRSLSAVAVGLRTTLRRLEATSVRPPSALVALPFAFGLHALVDLGLDFLAVAAPTMLVSAVLLGAGRPAAGKPGGLKRAVTRGRPRRRLGARGAGALDPARSKPPTAKSSERQARRGRLRCAPRAAAEPACAGAALRSSDGRDGGRRPGRAPRRSTFRRRASSPRTPPRGTSSGCSATSKGDLCGAYYALNAAYTLDPRAASSTGQRAGSRKDAVNDTEEPGLRSLRNLSRR